MPIYWNHKELSKGTKGETFTLTRFPLLAGLGKPLTVTFKGGEGLNPQQLKARVIKFFPVSGKVNEEPIDLKGQVNDKPPKVKEPVKEKEEELVDTRPPSGDYQGDGFIIQQWNEVFRLPQRKSDIILYEKEGVYVAINSESNKIHADNSVKFKQAMKAYKEQEDDQAAD